VYNFKEHPVVKRMLSLDYDIDRFPHSTHLQIMPENIEVWKTLLIIKNIGGATEKDLWFYRMLYYANEILKLNPSSICEIGGGVGQFYAILRALGWKGSYCIMDLTPVQEFQIKYLAEVEKQTGLQLQLSLIAPEMIVSFYALGEFDDFTKKQYKGLISAVQRGYIAWNSHSGASDDLSLFKHDIKVTPGIEPGIKIIQW
jgi:hypothetical protein